MNYPGPTITLNTPLTIQIAMEWLKEGRCLGIKPGSNLRYMTLLTPERGSVKLVWAGSTDGSMMAEQITDDWFPVIVDHRALNKPTASP